MDLKQKEAYVATIKLIYGNSVHATESQITEEVGDIVDEMLEQIKTCTLRIAPLATFVQGIAGGITGLLESRGMNGIMWFQKAYNRAFLYG